MKTLNFFQNSPKTPKIDVEAYLKRIGQKKQPPSLSYLKALHKAHQVHIPFENLDIHYGAKITLDYRRIFDKIIYGNRGGFCYELNGLFYHLLSNLGFPCYVVSAEVMNHERMEFGRPFDHMMIVVQMEEEKWLADVGFGKGIIHPLKIVPGLIQIDFTKYWKIEEDPDKNLILMESDNAVYFKTQLRFTTEERQLIEFLPMCEYHQTSRESPFTQKKWITRLLPDGRVTLTDRELRITQLGHTSVSEILNEDEFLSCLEQHFGIRHHQLIPQKK